MYLAIIVLAIILAIVLGLTAVLVAQIKTMKELGNSVGALYAADTGVERSLRAIIFDKEVGLQGTYEENLGGGKSYKAVIYCCNKSVFASCELDNTPGNVCPVGFLVKDGCRATRYCIESRGSYGGTIRALQARVYPTE